MNKSVWSTLILSVVGLVSAVTVCIASLCFYFYQLGVNEGMGVYK